MSLHPRTRRRAASVLVVAGGALVLGACGDSKSPAGATAVNVALTDQGCSLDRPSVPAGPVSFKITNKDSARVTEAELVGGGRILAERENIVAGLDGSFSYSINAGAYEINCPGGTGAQSVAFTVTGAASTSAASGTAGQQFTAAALRYVTYVQQQVGLLQTNTTTFTDAVRAGDLDAARAAYPAARVYYERIEPVAESFGDLDPAIDNRIDDAGSLAKLTGFHRIEYAMYQSKSLAGMAPVATQLDKDVAKLKMLVATVKFQPAEVANGATSLLDEVGKTKITGEEERYSHIDFVDLVANVDGAREGYELLKPGLETVDPSLASQADAAFATVENLIQKYSTGTGPTDYKSFADVPAADRKAISQAVDALAAPLSKVGGEVVKA